MDKTFDGDIFLGNTNTVGYTKGTCDSAGNVCGTRVRSLVRLEAGKNYNNTLNY